jgi:hypothetical protein
MKAWLRQIAEGYVEVAVTTQVLWHQRPEAEGVA